MNELKHYGVLGMKWGVRRFQPYRKGERKGKEVGEAKRKSKFEYDDDIVLKKGSTAYRLSTSKTENTNQRYVTVDQNDRNFYKGTWGNAMRGSAGSMKKGDTLYEHKYKTTEDLISPSAAKRQRYASEMFDDPEILRELGRNLIRRRSTQMIDPTTGKNANWDTAKKWVDHWEAIKDKNYLNALDRETVDLKNDFDNKSELERATYVLSNMGGSDLIKVKFGEKVIKEGYNMVIDDHGADFAGNGQRVNAPLIVLKANAMLDQIGSKKISDYSEREALYKYSSDINSIPGKMSKQYFVPNVVKKGYNEDNYYSNPTFSYIYK